MNLPKVIADLVAAQNNYNSIAYTNCFSELAVVFDEGKTYNGKEEIKNWIAHANTEYKPLMKPVSYLAATQTLKAEITGTFPGSPVLLTYYFEINNDKIKSLKIDT